MNLCGEYYLSEMFRLVQFGTINRKYPIPAGSAIFHIIIEKRLNVVS